MTVLEYLNQNHCTYRVTDHKTAYTADQLAKAEHITPKKVAKPVILRIDSKYYVCVLAANRKIDLYEIQKHFKAQNVRLASEHEMEFIFGDAELGAEPPIGSMYHLETLMDKKLAKDKEIVFQAGSHQQAIWMTMDEYKHLTNPVIFSFSYPEVYDEIESMPFDPFYYDPYGV